jgi:IS5 family transposase
MRQLFDPQLELGATPIEDIIFNARSRDDIPQLLRGLQHIYTIPTCREAVFEILQNNIKPDTSFDNGRPGMDLWVILVLGTLRLGLGCDYDRLHDLANEHRTIRMMLGHNDWEDGHIYGLQTLRDNVSLLTESMLQEINKVVVDAGHGVVEKKESDTLKARCDSFVVETHVEYPTDAGMLFDALQKIIVLTKDLCSHYNINGLRQWSYKIKRLKACLRNAQQSHRSRRSDSEKYKHKVYKKYLRVAQEYIDRSIASMDELIVASEQMQQSKELCQLRDKLKEIAEFQGYAVLLHDQIEQRILLDVTISANEKIFSIFQPHTEWISKGKAGVPFELGLKVCILEDQHQFILHHQVMEKCQDVDVAVPMVKASQDKFPDLASCSFDKGFHSISNQADLADILTDVILPKKGKLSSKQKIKEHSADFKQARRQHSAVESAINALEYCGLDRCRDHGIDGFKRYVALAILSRNLKRLGTLLIQKERAQLTSKKRSENCAQAA